MSRLLVLCVTLLSTGCALQAEHIDLTYRPAHPASSIPAAAGRTVTVVAQDGRKGDPQIVSVKKNGYGMELGDLVANQPVLGLIQSAIAQELAARGFTIATGGAIVSVELERFFADYKNGFLTMSAKADVNMLVQVKSPAGQVLYTRVIAESARPDGALLGTPSLARESLDAALQTAVATMVQDPQFLAALQTGGGTPVAELRMRPPV